MWLFAAIVLAAVPLVAYLIWDTFRMIRVTRDALIPIRANQEKALASHDASIDRRTR